MISLSDSERAQITRNVAALREHGWSAGRALALVAENVPAGDMRTRLIGFAAELERGETPDDPTDDPLLAVLSRGEQGGSTVLLEATHAFELRHLARRTAQQFMVGGLGALISLVLLAFLYQFVLVPVLTDLFAGFGSELPFLTTFVIEYTRGVGRFITPIFGVGAIVLFVLVARAGAFPGISGMLSAARLRIFAAAVDAGIPEGTAVGLIGKEESVPFYDVKGLRLNKFDVLLAKRLTEMKGSAASARALAEEKETEGSRIWEVIGFLVPLAGFVLLIFGVVVLQFAMYLPIFTFTSVVF